ncbi:MAG: arylsulfatase, partial [Proteobacteria bacterium]|nr:arylsulfatase [Pseudomonadota bacterium]
YWKQTTHEGGVHDPMILAWPSHFKDPGGIRTQFTHVIDIAPTLLALTGVKMPDAVRGVLQAPFEGTSFVQVIENAGALIEKRVQYFEMLGNRAIWVDGWKATAFHGRMPWDTTTSNPDFANDKWELFNVAEDFSEVNDLAAEFPEKLAELKITFDREARRYNVYPLDDSTSARLASTYRNFFAGVEQFKYEQGDVRISEAASPPVKNRSHTISAVLEVPEGGADGVLVACGGRFGGYSVYVKNKRVHYVHNFLGQAIYGVTASEDLPFGSVAVRVEFTRTGENRGKVAIFHADKLVGEANVPQTVPKAFSIAETFDVGEDSGSPVTDAYKSPFSYEGGLKSLQVDLIDD